MSSGVTPLVFEVDIGSGGYEKETRDAEGILYKAGDVHTGGYNVKCACV